MDKCNRGKNLEIKGVITAWGGQTGKCKHWTEKWKVSKIPTDYRGMMLYTAYTIPMDFKCRACCDKCFANGSMEIEIYSLHSRKDKQKTQWIGL